MKRKLSNSRILITGASSGVGRELALQLDRKGARLVMTARREDRLKEIAEKLNQAPILMAGDITSPVHRGNLFEAMEKQLDGLDVLINNAGVGAMGRFDGAEESRLRQVMEVNFFAPAEMTRLAIPLLKKSNQGAVVNVSSVLGHCAVPEKSEYCASKFALHGFSDSLRGELKEDNIDLVLVSPSTIKTEFFDSAIEDNTGTDWDKRPGMSPEYVARKTIAALEWGTRETILPMNGKFFVWLDRLLPGFSEKLIRNFLKKSQD